jgi:predicted alpha-1,6-mannanase (GH76 family)
MAISIRELKDHQRARPDPIITEFPKPEQKIHKKSLLTKLKRGIAVAAVSSIALISPSTSTLAPRGDVPFEYTQEITSPPLSKAETGIAVLQQSYDPSSGLWNGASWWQDARIFNTIVTYAASIGSSRYDWEIRNTFNINSWPGFADNYSDDNGWWSIAWANAYSLTGKETYLQESEALFRQMESNWTGSCGGGLVWSRSTGYKNAISNELFLKDASILYIKTGSTYYLDWADREYKWLMGSGMINRNGLVNDGLTASCRNNGGTEWTYNQGELIGALSYFYVAAGNQKALQVAESVADSSMENLTYKGILSEPACTPASTCHYGQGLFKGAYIDNLYYLFSITGKERYAGFILRNARSIWSRDRNGNYQFGFSWNGRNTYYSISTEDSGTDAEIAAKETSGQVLTTASNPGILGQKN